MSQTKRADISDQQYLEDQVRSLQRQLAVSQGETQGAMKLGMQIHSRATDVDAQLTSMGQARARVLRDLQLVRGAFAELVVDIVEDRDPVAAADRVVKSLVLQGVPVSGDIQQVLDSRQGRAGVAVAGGVSSPATGGRRRQDGEPSTTPERAAAEAVSDASEAAAAAVAAG